ncbi:clavata3 esr -related protein 25-like [Hordeum vulgare]|nr:clavata3 esr -related protein 25-like [Hordeum vulgare]
MGRRPDRSVGASACCGRVVVVIFIVCIALLVLMVATTSGAGVSLGPARARGGVTTTTRSSSPGRNSGAGQVGEDAYRSSKRRIPKGPDPIHNRRAGKTTIAPRRRD